MNQFYPIEVSNLMIFNIFNLREKSLSLEAKSVKFMLQHNKAFDDNLTISSESVSISCKPYIPILLIVCDNIYMKSVIKCAK